MERWLVIMIVAAAALGGMEGNTSNRRRKIAEEMPKPTYIRITNTTTWENIYKCVLQSSHDFDKFLTVERMDSLQADKDQIEAEVYKAVKNILIQDPSEKTLRKSSAYPVILTLNASTTVAPNHFASAEDCRPFACEKRSEAMTSSTIATTEPSFSTFNTGTSAFHILQSTVYNTPKTATRTPVMKTTKSGTWTARTVESRPSAIITKSRTVTSPVRSTEASKTTSRTPFSLELDGDYGNHIQVTSEASGRSTQKSRPDTDYNLLPDLTKTTESSTKASDVNFGGEYGDYMIDFEKTSEAPKTAPKKASVSALYDEYGDYAPDLPKTLDAPNLENQPQVSFPDESDYGDYFPEKPKAASQKTISYDGEYGDYGPDLRKTSQIDKTATKSVITSEKDYDYGDYGEKSVGFNQKGFSNMEDAADYGDYISDFSKASTPGKQVNDYDYGHYVNDFVMDGPKTKTNKAAIGPNYDSDYGEFVPDRRKRSIFYV